MSTMKRSVCLLIENDQCCFAGLYAPKHEDRPELAGGKLEEGETWEQAAQREGLEELGVEVTNLRLVARLPVGIPNGETHDCCFYAADLARPELGLGKGNEGPTAWLSREELLERGTYRAFLPAVLDAYYSFRFHETSGK